MLNNRLLTTIAILFLTVFVLFMAFGAYSGILLSGDVENLRENAASIGDSASAVGASALEIADAGITAVKNLYRQTQTQMNMTDFISLGTIGAGTEASGATESESALFSSPLTRRIAIVASADDESASRVLEWCVYTKSRYRVFNALPDASELDGFSAVIFVSPSLYEGASDALYAFAESGITMLFAAIPEYSVIASDEKLRDLLGIASAVSGNYPVDGVHIYNDFYLSKERIYTRDDYFGNEDDMPEEIPYYTLRAGYEVYAAAHIEDFAARGLTNDVLPPLLWRTVTGLSQVYVVGSELFSGDALIGTMSAMLSRASSVSVYPVVNAKTVSIISYPWLSMENVSEIASIYGHKPDTLSLNIMWPGIVQALYGYGQNTNVFISAQQDYSSLSDESQSAMLTDYFAKEIEKRLGTISLSLMQLSDESLDAVVKRNEEFFAKYLPKYRFTTLYAGGFRPEELLSYIGKSGSLLEKVKCVFTSDDKSAFLSYIGEDTLAVRLFSNGLNYEARDDISMLSLSTALGAMSQYVSFSGTLYPKTEEDAWNAQSIRWSSGTTYFNDLSAFDYVSVFGMEDRARAFLDTDYSYSLGGGRVRIKRSGEGEYFVVRLFTDEITGISGGEYESLTDSSYLVKAEADEVVLETKPKHGIGK
ncbi:MAG: hypothetical protein PHI27_02700 [Eubacteriales bacterium]|nr:hypothetical protein [Eubacteriales bacterium]MDD3881143.1 hypothetical protein [Eubacteriales bacterium]MDD4511525.1 hypothetical protein [Eubacteriales bacterium]